MFCVAYSSGREVVQVKILHKKQQMLLEKGKNPESVHQVELAEEEESKAWTYATAWYSFAMTLCFAVLALYLTFLNKMVKSNVCKFV